MSQWPSAKAELVLNALPGIGSQLKRQFASRVKAGQSFMFAMEAFHLAAVPAASDRPGK